MFLKDLRPLLVLSPATVSPQMHQVIQKISGFHVLNHMRQTSPYALAVLSQTVGMECEHLRSVCDIDAELVHCGIEMNKHNKL